MSQNSVNTHPCVPFGRPYVSGKFIFSGDEKLYIRGVTYGPFRPDESGQFYHTPEIVGRDFARIKASHINTVRTYTIPPRWLLDVAQEHGLRVMIGLPSELHAVFLDDRKRTRETLAWVRENVRSCAGHPALLGYALGNEIQASIVRWFGHKKVERFLYRLYRAAKSEDPGSLFAYVNYPTTEYLQLPFVDFVCFNVYLETREQFEGYLARLQNIAGDKPLIMGEIGLDSLRNGEETQAEKLDWQVRAAFEGGCAGTFVYSWTDEWFTRGIEITDWKFGLTERDRTPKPALAAISQAYSEMPFPPEPDWPRISVVVCTYNGSRTIRECLEGLQTLDYPNYEVIVVDDGSTDGTKDIASEFDFCLISTENRGLSNARNTGLERSTGEIVAYIDDDTRPDPQWLHYMAHTFLTTDYVGVGGPNISPPEDGLLAEAVNNAPGNPSHVLLTDIEAEHLPGCNMAFRKSALEAINGFDPQFRIAGDDVDICWRLQQKGGILGFSPAAVVWHHRRNSIKAFLKQQFNYGEAEAMLQHKWPEKYNTFGHPVWHGKLYGVGPSVPRPFSRWRIYHGVWGSRPFQSIYETRPNTFLAMTLMPEWYMTILFLLAVSVLGAFWRPLLWASPFLFLSLMPQIFLALKGWKKASFSDSAPRTRGEWLKLRSLTAALHFLQPLARLSGRLRFGLRPWRRNGPQHYALPRRRTSSIWSETWKASEARLENIEAAFLRQAAVVARGGDFDRWDLEIIRGPFGSVRLLMAIEEYAGGRQSIRLRTWPRFSIAGLLLGLLFALLTILAIVDLNWAVSIPLSLISFVFIVWTISDCAAATASCLRIFEQIASEEQEKVKGKQ